MVCLGNICRSPLAQGILEHKSAKAGLNWEIDSAGTSGYHSGDKPDRRSIEVAKKYGIDITNQRSRKVYAFDIEQFDLIYAMDRSNFYDLQTLVKEEGEAEKIRLIMDEVFEEKSIDVPDPYYDDDGFEQVYKMLDLACEKIVERYTR